MVKVIKVRGTLEFFGMVPTGRKIEIIKGLPEDAKLIYFEHNLKERCLEFYYETEEGQEIGEGVYLDQAEIYEVIFRYI